MRDSQRLASLDGLRGIAAVVVLIHHGMLTFPQLADGYYDHAARDPLAWILSYTPLHAFWAGSEAVYLFFVLSGVVLVLPVVRRGRAFSWASYYPSRILRLYIPVAAAVIFGAVLVLVVSRYKADGLGAWINSREAQYTAEGFVRDLVLIFGPSRVISPLWSLRWEVLFSLLLPLFVLLAVAFHRMWWLKVVTVFALIIVGSLVGSEYLFFLPIFGVGALVIAEWDRIGKAARTLDGHAWAWPSLVIAAALLTTCTWTLAGVGGDLFARAIAWIPIAGVTLLVIAAAHYAPARRLLETRVVTWLGAISFALYLVHEPLIIAARLLTFPLSPWVGLLLSVPLAFLVAWLFARFVERPSHRFSKWVGALVATRMTRPGESEASSAQAT